MSKTQLFFNFFATEILPYEVKYSAITGTRDYELQVGLMSLLFQMLKADEAPETFIDLNIMPIAEAYQQNYLDKLLDVFGPRLKCEAESVLKDSSYFDGEALIVKKCIERFEKSLGIDSVSQTCYVDIDKHIADSVYSKDFERLNDELRLFVDAYSSLSRWKSENMDLISFSHDLTPESYWVLVVNNEAWNFLSHLSHGITHFERPKAFVSNMSKGIAHLSRATLDIYDGLITFSNMIEPEYIEIKISKLVSLGEGAKIRSVNERLKEYYELRTV